MILSIWAIEIQICQGCRGTRHKSNKPWRVCDQCKEAYMQVEHRIDVFDYRESERREFPVRIGWWARRIVWPEIP